MILLRRLALLMYGSLFLSACNLNAPDGEDGDTEPSPESRFEIISTRGLSGSTTKAEAADLDNNGALDLVIAIAGQPNKILMNDGSGGFYEDSQRLPHQDFAFDTRDVAVADFTGDAYADILFVSNQTSGYEFYINNQQGYYSDLTNRIPTSDIASSVAAWDIDNSGTLDLLVGTVGQNIMLLNNGSVVFSNQTDQRLPTHVEVTTDIKVGDLTGDNLLDIITSSNQTIRILVNTGSGVYVDRSDQLLPLNYDTEEIHDIELRDINNDGLMDVFLGISGEDAELAINDRLLINQGQGVFSDESGQRLPDLPVATIDAEWADLDTDGDWDLLIGSANQGVYILLNNGNGRFENHSDKWLPEDFLPAINDLEVADFNNDNLQDLFISVQEGDDQMLLQK